MAKAPDISCQSLCLVRGKLRPTHRRHRAAILLRFRHAFRYRFQDSSKAAIAPQPFLAAEIRTQGRTSTIRAMASRTGRTAHLTVVDAITQGNHLWRHTVRKRDACIWMSALRRLGGGCDDIACRSRRTGARSDCPGTASGAALINNSVDPSAHIVGNVERTIGSDCKARGTMCCALWSH